MVRPDSSKLIIPLTILLAVLCAVAAWYQFRGPYWSPEERSPEWMQQFNDASKPGQLSAQLWMAHPRVGNGSDEAMVTELLRAQNKGTPPKAAATEPVSISAVSVDGSPVTAKSASAATVVAPEEYVAHAATPRPAGS